MKKFTQILTAIILAVFAMPAVAQTETAIQNNAAATLIPYKTLVEKYKLADLEYKTGSDLNFYNTSKTTVQRQTSAYDSSTAIDGSTGSWFLGSNKYYGDIIIPEGVTTLRKGGWGDGTGAFQCSYITSVNLPATLTTINGAAFADCPYLEAITVAEGNKNFVSIDGCLYQINKNKVPTTLIAVPASKANVQIVETVTAIAESAFDGCRFIKQLTISSETLSSVGNYGFADMNLESLTIFATSTTSTTINYSAPSTSSDTFENCSIGVIYVDESMVDKYKEASGWKEYPIEPIKNVVVAGTFTLNANLTLYKNDKNEVYQIAEIQVTGKEGETFATDSLPTGWTLTYEDGTSYEPILKFKDNKTVQITFKETIETTGTYTLAIPAHSLKTADGTKENDLAQFYWVIQEAEVVTKTEKKPVVLKMNDSEGNFSWSYTGEKGAIVNRNDTHIVGNTLYIKAGEPVKNQGTITITTTEYYSSNAEYVRTFNNNKWQALYVPFELDFDKLALSTLEIAVIKDVFENVDKENNVVWFYVTAEVLEAGQKIPANTPCIIRSIQTENATGVSRTLSLVSGSRIEAIDGKSFDVTGNGGNTYRFKGQYTAGNLPKNDYTFAMSKGALCQPASEAVNLGAYRWYLEIYPTVNSTATFSFGRFDDVEGTTGLENVKVEIVDNDVYYDLSGRRVENPTKGIYIKNGKKVYVK